MIYNFNHSNSSSFNQLPCDALDSIAQYLHPKDFYSMRSVGISIDETAYWHMRHAALNDAIKYRSPGLARYFGQTRDAHELVWIMTTTTESAIQETVCQYYTIRFPKNIEDLAHAFVVTGDTRMFVYVVARHPSAISEDTIDIVYIRNKFAMLSVLFVKTPRIFINWTFGNYKQAADPEVIRNAVSGVATYLDRRHCTVLLDILQKYSQWLWQYQTGVAATRDTIAAIDDIVQHHTGMSASDKYSKSTVKYALASPHAEFLEYLVYRGLHVVPEMFRATNDPRKLKLLWKSNIAQKYSNIMVMLAILVAATVVNIFSAKFDKIEKSGSINNPPAIASTIVTSANDNPNRSKTLHHIIQSPSGRLGISRNTTKLRV